MDQIPNEMILLTPSIMLEPIHLPSASTKKRLSQSKKAVRERNLRRTNNEVKHFSLPLYDFLKYKYPQIYVEYNELYTNLKRLHPNRRDLRKTITFKNWLSTNSTNILEATLREYTVYDDPPVETTVSATATMDAEIDTAPGTGSDRIPPDAEDDVDTMSTDASDTADIDPDSSDDADPAPDTTPDDPVSDEVRAEIPPTDEGVGVRLEVDELLNEILRIEGIQEYLENVEDEEVVEEDEGVALDIHDEIEFDIQDFEYELEVEAGDW